MARIRRATATLFSVIAFLVGAIFSFLVMALFSRNSSRGCLRQRMGEIVEGTDARLSPPNESVSLSVGSWSFRREILNASGSLSSIAGLAITLMVLWCSASNPPEFAGSTPTVGDIAGAPPSETLVADGRQSKVLESEEIVPQPQRPEAPGAGTPPNEVVADVRTFEIFESVKLMPPPQRQEAPSAGTPLSEVVADVRTSEILESEVPQLQRQAAPSAGPPPSESIVADASASEHLESERMIPQPQWQTARSTLAPRPLNILSMTKRTDSPASKNRLGGGGGGYGGAPGLGVCLPVPWDPCWEGRRDKWAK